MHARLGDPDLRAVARTLLEDLLTSMVARRREPKAAEQEDPPVRRVFREGAITGLCWPLGAELPLFQVLAWLQETVPVLQPLVLDPALPPDRLVPVKPGELLPQTASGLLQRLLLSRGLFVEDLGPVFMVRDLGERDGAPDHERSERLEPGQADGRECRMAAILTHALVDRGNVDAPELPAALFRSFGQKAAARVAASEWSRLSGLPAHWLAQLSIGAESAPARLQLELLGSTTPESSRLAQLLHLGRLAPLARPLLDDLLASDDPTMRRAGCFLAARCRAQARQPALERCLRDSRADVRIAAALALSELAELAGGDRGAADGFFETLARGVPAESMGPVLQRATALRLSRGPTVASQNLLRSPDPWASAVGAALLGIGGESPRLVARWLALDRPLSLAAYSLGATHASHRDEAVELPWAVLVGALASTPELEGALAEILARQIGPALQGSAWLSEARRAARAGDPLMLGMLLARVARDLTRDDSYPASVLLRSALRPVRELNEPARIAHAELTTALSTPEGGARIRLLQPVRMPFAP